MSEIIQEALAKYKPVKVLLMFSGGHDSLCSTHRAAIYLKSIGVPFTVYHGNTGIGVRQAREYVYKVVELYGWDFYEGHPRSNETYKEIVKRWGVPRPNISKPSNDVYTPKRTGFKNLCNARL